MKDQLQQLNEEVDSGVLIEDLYSFFSARDFDKRKRMAALSDPSSAVNQMIEMIAKSSGNYKDLITEALFQFMSKMTNLEVNIIAKEVSEQIESLDKVFLLLKELQNEEDREKMAKYLKKMDKDDLVSYLVNDSPKSVTDALFRDLFEEDDTIRGSTITYSREKLFDYLRKRVDPAKICSCITENISFGEIMNLVIFPHCKKIIFDKVCNLFICVLNEQRILLHSSLQCQRNHGNFLI